MVPSTLASSGALIDLASYRLPCAVEFAHGSVYPCSLVVVDLILLTFALLVVFILIMAVVAKAFEGYSVRDLLDWQPVQTPEVEAQNEADDVRQMLEAGNELRRRHGHSEITEADVHRQAAEDQMVRSRGTGPFEPEDHVDQDAEEEDLRQTLEASNALRRRHGQPELTEADFERQGAEDLELREHISGEFHQSDHLVEEHEARNRKPPQDPEPERS